MTYQNGFIYGNAYRDLLENCKSNHYALPAVNVTSSSTTAAVMMAARKMNAPVIVQISNGGAAAFAGTAIAEEAGLDAKIQGAVAMADYVQAILPLYDIPVILHTDHANKSLLPWIEGLLDISEQRVKQGRPPVFSSHMVDLSEESLQDNLDTVIRLLKKANPLGISIELEIGITGGEEDGIGQSIDSIDNKRLYTQPEDVVTVYKVLQGLGYYTLAAAFGNVHGVYKPGNVKLHPEILQESQNMVRDRFHTAHNSIPLVFHGGSGSSKDKIQQALNAGVVKMNIDTDTQFAYSKGCFDVMEKTPEAFRTQIGEEGTPYKKYYDPRKWIKGGEQLLTKRVIEAYKDLNYPSAK